MHDRSGRLASIRVEHKIRRPCSLLALCTVIPSITRADGDAVWTSPNASDIFTSSSLLIPDLATSYLAISGAGLREGATYVLGVSSYGGHINEKVDGEFLVS